VPAGENVTIHVPASSLSAGLHVQISGHKDSICGKRSSYGRVCTPPARRFALDKPSVLVRTAFGGALYIDVGKKPLPTACVLCVESREAGTWGHVSCFFLSLW